ncbi:ninja-family protein mc410-like [Cornus florida]|uniref:ninja-family protein mc410-like n=1 Tax=Cornus florida TaxID=4283 RepID=UPI0028A2AAAD|nr:ninja-family protein mc410-like [Cornus florida]
MKDENRLELRLGLSLGGSSVESEGTNGISADSKANRGDRGNKLVDDFKNFQKQEYDSGAQKSDPVKPEENFFRNLSSDMLDVDGSRNLNEGGLLVADSSRSAKVEEENIPQTGNEPKILFDETSHRKKRERESHHAEIHEKRRTSHISINTDDGSTADNEDVADSEFESSTSRLVPHHDSGSKRYIGSGGSSEVPKEVRMVNDSTVVDLQGQKRSKISSEKEFSLGNMPYKGVPFLSQSTNIMNFHHPLHVESNSVSAPSTSGYPIPGMMQVMAVANSERSGAHTLMPGNLPLMFGCSPVQLPSLDKDNSWGLVSHPQLLHPSLAGRGLSNSDKQTDGLKISQAAMPGMPHKSSEAPQYDGRALERAKIDGKEHATGEGSSSQTKDDENGSNMILWAKNSSDHPSEYPAIRPGIDADLKFGGCGSYPDLPWVSTTGLGPNGRTISGATYRYSATQIRIVCACHGSHMSPEEFVRHANEEQTNPATAGMVSFQSSNPASSAQS